MRNPTRRNRNIGTKKQGHGQDNRLVIPHPGWTSCQFQERLKDPVQVARDVEGQPFRFFVEPPRNGFKHSCTIDDVCKLLSYIPVQDREPITSVVFRQPTAKEEILAGVWGRLLYWSVPLGGPTIFLESITDPGSLRWSRSFKPGAYIELERMRRHGHRVVEEPRHYVLHFDLESVRSTQLFQTVAHEIGHYVHYMEYVENASEQELDLYGEDTLWERYHAKANQEKEGFANRYADEFFRRLQIDGKLPFPRMFNERKIARDGLNPTWFRPK